MNNPFIPNHPIDPARFVGREEEVRTLKEALLGLRLGKSRHFAITGEMGIGKTSLLTYLHYMCRGRISLDSSGSRFNGIVIHTRIRQNSTDIGIAEKLGIRLERELADTDIKTKMSNLWKIISRIKACGFGIDKNNNSLRERESLLEEFSEQLVAAARRLCSESGGDRLLNPRYDGIVILMDECDRASPETNIGSFYKYLLEDVSIGHNEIPLGRRNHIMICLAGLPTLHSKLADSHESSARIFSELRLGRLSTSDAGSVVDVALEYYRREFQDEKFIDLDARDMIVTLAEGHPYHIQCLGYSAFAASPNVKISPEDVAMGVFRRGGGLQMIGNARYRSRFFEKFNDEQQEIALAIARSWSAWVDKEEVMRKFPLGRSGTREESLVSIVKDGTLIKKGGISNQYRFSEKAFGLWLALYVESCEDPESQNEVRIVMPSREDLDSYYLVAFCGYMSYVALECLRRAKAAFYSGRDDDAEELLLKGFEVCEIMNKRASYGSSMCCAIAVSGIEERIASLITEIRGPGGLFFKCTIQCN